MNSKTLPTNSNPGVKNPSPAQTKANTMATMPKEYWETYERKSPHLSGKNTTPRLFIRCDWTLIDNAAEALGFSSGSALVTELAHRAATSPPKFQTLVNEIEAGSFDWAGVRGRLVASTHWDKPGVADAVREALRRISYGPDLEGAG